MESFFQKCRALVQAGEVIELGAFSMDPGQAAELASGLRRLARRLDSASDIFSGQETLARNLMADSWSGAIEELRSCVQNLAGFKAKDFAEKKRLVDRIKYLVAAADGVLEYEGKPISSLAVHLPSSGRGTGDIDVRVNGAPVYQKAAFPFLYVRKRGESEEVAVRRAT